MLETKSSEPRTKRKDSESKTDIIKKKQKTSKRGLGPLIGSQYIIFTSFSGKEARSRNEVLNCLTTVYEEIYNTSNTVNNDSNKSISDMISDEIDIIKINKSIFHYDNSNRQVLRALQYFKINDNNINVTTLVTNLYDKIIKTKIPLTRFTNSILPIEKSISISNNNLQDLKIEAELLIKKYFPDPKLFDNNNNLNWCVKFKARFNTNCKKDKMKYIDTVVDIVKTFYNFQKVNLTSPEVVFILEIIDNWLGMGVINNGYTTKYNGMILPRIYSDIIYT